MKVVFCRSCGRINDSEFSFCPWCGTAAYESVSLERIISGAFGKIEESAKEGVAGKMERLKKLLEELEEDLAKLPDTRMAPKSVSEIPRERDL